MELGWWQILIIVVSCIAGVVLGLFGVLQLIMAMFFPDNFREFWMPKAKIAQIRKDAIDFVGSHAVPPPPELHCPECNEKLTWYYLSVTQRGEKYDVETGREQFRVAVRYECPNGHFPGAAGNGKIWWTHWGKNSSWRWAA